MPRSVSLEPTEEVAMGRHVPSNLISFFSGSIKTFQLSQATFKVLCSLPSSSQPAPTSIQRPPRTLLVLDSSFNPPTLAHQRMALSALGESKYCSDSRVLLLLAINNADKAPKPAAFPQRLAMMYIFALDLLSAAKTTGTEVDIAVTTEPYFHSKSGAIATSDFYRGSGESKGPQLEQIYLTGFDTLIRIFNPKYYPGGSMRAALDPFFSHSHLRVHMRTDAEWGGATEQIAYLENLRSGKLEDAGGRREWASNVEMVEGRQEGEEVISSTKVRDAVQREDWESLKKFVSGGVADWVREQHLYKETDL